MAKSPWAQAFDQGYACAVANIIRTHGEDGIARDVLSCNRPDPKYIEESDREVLERAHLLSRRRRARKGEESAP